MATKRLAADGISFTLTDNFGAMVAGALMARCFVTIASKRVDCAPPFEGADHAAVKASCPKCGLSPFGVAGSGHRFSADDRAHEADGFCTSCKGAVGLIRFESDTLFGVREDHAVLVEGRCRVY